MLEEELARVVRSSRVANDTALAHDDVVGKAYDARLMRRLLTYLGPHVAAVAVAFA